MSPKIKTKEELDANIAKARNEIRQGENLIKQMQREVSKEERKARTNRLIQRGAIAESLIPEVDTLTNEQYKAVLSTGLKTDAAQKMLTFFKKSNNTAVQDETPTTGA